MVAQNKEIAIRVSGVKKKYKLGQISGGTLTADLQSWWARVRGREDPNSIIGSDQRLVGQTFMALNGIDLTVYKGETLGIIGGNGAGKSTLLKLLCRVTAPTEGEIDIYGRVASMLEVGTGFSGEMTGRENIYVNGAILGMTRAEIDAKIEDIIDFSEVRDFIDTPVKRYSSGMYVKLGFSVAAHLDSEIIIMDEVLAVGDMAYQKKCLDKMRAIARQQGRTVLYVSHNMNTIRQLCDRCIVLDRGRIVFEGDVEKAIAVYLKENFQEMGTSIDLSSSRMGHLPSDIEAKILNLQLLDKEDTVFEFNTDILFAIKVEAYRDVLRPCVRLEIYDGTDGPVGASLYHDLPPIMSGKRIDYSFCLQKPGLVPGRYKALVVLYEVNEFGTYHDLDAVWPAFTFEIIDSNGKLKIAWDHYHWGRVNFETI